MTEEQLLISLEEYLKSGIHIGTKFRTKFMSKFIYRVRPDGLSVLNIEQVNERIRLASNMLSKYNPEDILVVCRRENGWKAVRLFSKLTGIKSYTKRYPPGVLTNPILENFLEVKLILVVDPIPDKNAVSDAARLGIPVIALADTNNEAYNLDLVVPANNKGKKSLGLIFFILTKEYLRSRGIIKEDTEFKYKIEDFTDE